MDTPKCECDQEGQANPMIAHLYDPDTELPFVRHQPGECRCTNDLKQYERDGKVMWLCRCCWLPDDKLVDRDRDGAMGMCAEIGPESALCKVYTQFEGERPGTAEANARLISAAPELLTALERAEGFIRGFEDDESQEGMEYLLATIRHAIVKAGGTIA